MSDIPAVHGVVARVIDVPSQGNTYLRIELPIEYHAELTRLFYGKAVLVVLAGDAMSNKPYGVVRGGEAREAPPREPEAPPQVRIRRTERPAGGPLSKDAAGLCNNPAFHDYCKEHMLFGEGDKFDAGDAADYLREECGVRSRADLDHDETAANNYALLKSRLHRWIACREAAASHVG